MAWRPVICAFFLALGVVHAQEVGWIANGRDVEGTRYLPASEITRDNVARLEVAWTYHTGEADPSFKTSKATSFEATPLVVDGTMYLGTPLGRVIALDPGTGRQRWVFDPKIKRDVTYGDFASRGVSTWLDPKAPAGTACRRRIFVATAQSQLFALDARDGRPCTGFGRQGMVDLLTGLRIPPFEPEAYSMTSPPLVVNGLVVTGSSVADNTRPDSASGEVRAYDARTGALAWTWDPIPQDPKDPAYGEWRGAMAHKGGAANAWSVLAADPERDLVFVPTGSAAPDYYGVLRTGDNRYANSIVALKASTGKVVWAFQTVHHDLWDYDNASPPALLTVTHGGAQVPAVVQATKTGMLFVLDRETGKPIFPVEERKVPASDIPQEQAAPTQPFTAAIAPLSPHRLATEEIWGLTDADRAACHAAIDGLRNEGIFTPPSVKGTLVLPSNIGGAHWGGVAVDPVRQIAVVPVNRIAAVVQLIPRESFDRERSRADDQRLGHDYEYNGMWGTPYVMRRRMLLSPSQLPCTPPPFGTLVAVDLKTGQRLWEVPLGSMTRPLPPEQAARVPREWGSPNLGGPIVTAGGVVFIGAALDRFLHAYDIETGRELWRGPLPESGKATPMSYRLASGEQFVAIAVGGGGAFGTGDALVAFRLPAAPTGSATRSTPKAFVGARVIDGTGQAPTEDAVVVVREGRIVSVGPRASVEVPKDAERVDLSGKTLIPGLINAHGHIGETVGLRAGPELYTRDNVLRQLRLNARYGITTVFSLGGDQDAGFRVRDEQDSPSLDRARLHVAGPVIVAPTPEEARRKVDEVAALKPDLVKIRVDDNLGTTEKMPPAVYQAVIDQAHKHGLRVAAHVFYLDDAKGVLAAGADFIAHSVRDRDVDDELIRRLKERDVCLCPTLMREVSTFVYESEPPFFSDPFFLREADPAVLADLRDPKRQEAMRTSAAAQSYKKALETASRNLRKLSDAGVRIAMGTDTGPPARFQGYFEHMELELMAKAGLTPGQILRSATGDAARCLNLDGKVGTVRPGATADFVVLARNPLDDIRNTRTIESVWIAGNKVPAR